MQCYIYRSPRKTQMYLYLPKKDQFESLPETLLKLFGLPEFSFKFELTSDRKLMRTTADKIKQAFVSEGYYLQLPPKNESVDSPFDERLWL